MHPLQDGAGKFMPTPSTGGRHCVLGVVEIIPTAVRVAVWTATL